TRNDASRDELQALKAAGVIGVAFNAAFLGVDYYKDIGPLLERLRELDMIANVQVEGAQLRSFRPVGNGTNRPRGGQTFRPRKKLRKCFFRTAT
ncbi:MAG: 2-pyrone-4,6-dicarboxylate hydrolase, partial [Variovorax sp.]|nr:2-pyrone-4,6-dicarboxylate hydrolase [Variovorax sp.]